MGHSLCSFILRQIPRRSPTHNAVYFTTTRLGGYTMGFFCLFRLIHEILKFGFKISILNEYRILREAGG